MKELTVAEAAYLAGLVDGEGSIALWRSNQHRKNGGTYRPIIEISNTHYGVLEWCLKTIGEGWLKATNPKNSRELGHKPLYRYRARTQDLRWLLPQIMPYMIIKWEQAELLSNYFGMIVNTRPTVDRTELEAIHNRLRVLNHRGLVKKD